MPISRGAAKATYASQVPPSETRRMAKACAVTFGFLGSACCLWGAAAYDFAGFGAGAMAAGGAAVMAALARD